MRRLVQSLVGMTIALATVGVLVGCDDDAAPEEAAATTVAGQRDAPLGSAPPPSTSAQDCRLVGNVSAVVAQVATIDDRSSVASAEATRDALLSSVEELKDQSAGLRRIDIQALNEGLAEVASAVNSASSTESVKSAVSSLQGSARDLEVAIQEVQDHFGCGPRTG